jgi:hypothetical protein
MKKNFLHEVLRKVKLTVRILEHPRLSLLAKLVFTELLLAFYNNENGRCDAAAKTIGKRIRRGERSVRAAIVELEGENALRSQQRRRGGPEYSFPGLDDDFEQEVQDRQESAGLNRQDRQISAPRPAENAPQDRQESADKPIKRTNKENRPSLRSGAPQGSRARGTRIPTDWRPSQADRDFAATMGLTPRQIETQARKFHNHWTAKPDNATKLDWSPMWQNWILDAIEKIGLRSGTQQIDRATVDWDLHVSRYRASGAWMPTLGPAPDHAGCKAPLDVLHRHGFGRAAGAA